MVDMIMLDLAKAFDVVSHVVLLDKLRDIGVNATLLSWKLRFLTNRTMRVSVGVFSSVRGESSDVTQGSVLCSVLSLFKYMSIF